jgi:APA family basic amino acid/polyamine antiporter
MFWLCFFYAMALIPILTGLNVAQVGSMVMILSNLINLVINLFLVRLPDKVPNEYAVSKFKVSKPTLVIISVVACVVACFNLYFLTSSMTPRLIITNVIMLVATLLYCLWRTKSGKVHMEVSHESS